jgi:ATP-dependent Clp protease ATP-binding subunit ClpA
MLEPNKDLEKIFEQAVQLATTNHHEYVTLEHFLFSMLNNETFAKILEAFGTDVKQFREDIENYITNDLKEIVNEESSKPKKDCKC